MLDTGSDDLARIVTSSLFSETEAHSLGFCSPPMGEVANRPAKKNAKRRTSKTIVQVCQP